MHELSICRAIAQTAESYATDRKVVSVRLRIGHFRQVVPETLSYCWDLHTRDTALDGCRLEVDYVRAVVHCNDCGADTTLADPILLCGSCGSRTPTLISGEEFLVDSIEVADRLEPPDQQPDTPQPTSTGN